MGWTTWGRALAALAMTVSGAPAWALVGRTEAAPDFARNIVTVLTRDASRAGFCSGVVIGPRAILTAAHCVRAATDTRILSRDAANAPVLLPVATVARHPDYRADAIAARKRSVDLAVIVLAEPLPASFAAVAIATGSDTIGAPFDIAGVGLTREGDEHSAGALRTGRVTLRAPLSPLLLWLTGDAGACTGDSGGAVFAPDGSLVGIIAFAQGEGGKRCGALTQAVRVAPFAAWIAANASP